MVQCTSWTELSGGARRFTRRARKIREGCGVWFPNYVLSVCSPFLVLADTFPSRPSPSSRCTLKALPPRQRHVDHPSIVGLAHRPPRPCFDPPLYRFSSKSVACSSVSIFVHPPHYSLILSSLTHLTFDNLTPYFPFTISDAHLYTVIVESSQYQPSCVFLTNPSTNDSINTTLLIYKPLCAFHGRDRQGVNVGVDIEGSIL